MQCRSTVDSRGLLSDDDDIAVATAALDIDIHFSHNTGALSGAVTDDFVGVRSWRCTNVVICGSTEGQRTGQYHSIAKDVVVTETGRVPAQGDISGATIDDTDHACETKVTQFFDDQVAGQDRACSRIIPGTVANDVGGSGCAGEIEIGADSTGVSVTCDIDLGATSTTGLVDGQIGIDAVTGRYPQEGIGVRRVGEPHVTPEASEEGARAVASGNRVRTIRHELQIESICARDCRDCIAALISCDGRWARPSGARNAAGSSGGGTTSTVADDLVLIQSQRGVEIVIEQRVSGQGVEDDTVTEHLDAAAVSTGNIEECGPVHGHVIGGAIDVAIERIKGQAATGTDAGDLHVVVVKLSTTGVVEVEALHGLLTTRTKPATIGDDLGAVVECLVQVGIQIHIHSHVNPGVVYQRRIGKGSASTGDVIGVAQSSCIGHVDLSGPVVARAATIIGIQQDEVVITGLSGRDIYCGREGECSGGQSSEQSNHIVGGSQLDAFTSPNCGVVGVYNIGIDARRTVPGVPGSLSCDS